MGIFALLFAVLLLLSACGEKPSEANQTGSTPQTNTKSVDLTISAAASLTDALQEIKSNYEKNNKGVNLLFNFAASGTLQQQIEQGAPVDLFISAATKNMQALVDKQLIKQDQHTKLLANELVAITASDSKVKMTLKGVNELQNKDILKIAIGIPESVPAGSYAKEALTRAGVWDALQPKLVQAKDVRQVLQYVETGNVDVGFVYKTDALTSDKVQLAYTIDQASYTPIEYPIGIVQASAHAKEAEELYNYLQTKEAMEVFLKYGFSMPVTP
ncbi:molybdate ABC transporter substrate-binding protein [Paenibacillus albiflavus]|uniref:Molybdate ABC transporter substrate-binding protein n=2 Tax=Paenibacillus albiflavus TaxID=2545760 RepID=A0A4R4EP78_9BACL|nr:molybdate ABC transporter substrate-binding protein [Paenibacillus albiflavus]